MSSIDAVFDANVIRAITRSPAHAEAAREYDDVTRRIVDRLARAVIDRGAALESHWAETVGVELVREIIALWRQASGVVEVTSGTFPEGTRAIKRLGFHDPDDFLIVRVAAGHRGARIVTKDSDFWDPADTESVGATGPVADYLLEHLGIPVLSLAQFVAALPVSDANGSARAAAGKKPGRKRRRGKSR